MNRREFSLLGLMGAAAVMALSVLRVPLIESALTPSSWWTVSWYEKVENGAWRYCSVRVSSLEEGMKVKIPMNELKDGTCVKFEAQTLVPYESWKTSPKTVGVQLESYPKGGSSGLR